MPKLLKAAPVIASIGEAIGGVVEPAKYHYNSTTGKTWREPALMEGAGMEAFQQTFSVSGFPSVLQDLDYRMPTLYIKEQKIPQFSYDFKTKTLVQLPEISALDLERRAVARDSSAAARKKAADDVAYRRNMEKQQLAAEKAAAKAKRDADAKARELEKLKKKELSKDISVQIQKLTDKQLDDREDLRSIYTGQVASIEAEYTKNVKVLRANRDYDGLEDLRYWRLVQLSNSKLQFDSKLHDLTDQYRIKLNSLTLRKYD